MTAGAVVYVSEATPWPPHTGGQLRTLANLRSLAELAPTHLMLFPSAAPPSPLPEGAPPFASVQSVFVPRPGPLFRLAERVRATARLEQTYLERFRRIGGPDLVRRTIESVGASVVVLEFPFYPWLATAPPGRAVRFVGDVADDRVGVALATIRAGTGLSKRLRMVADLPALVRSERAVSRLDQVWMAAPHETERARARHPGTDVRVVPNVVAGDHLDAHGATPAGPGSAAFLGYFGYPPNAVAAVRFADSIVPALRARRPTCRLALVGRAPTPEVRAAAGRAGIPLLEDVPDAMAVLRDYGVLVVPLTFGGGTRLKILEALAAGVPVVSTRVGVQGLDLRHGEHLLVAERDEQLADAVVRLWDQPALARALVAAGSQAVRLRYSQERLTAVLRDALAGLGV